MRPYVVAWIDGLLGAGFGEALAPTYLVMLCTAFLLGTVLFMWVARHHGIDRRRALLALAVGYPAAMVGARLFTVFAQIPEAVATGNGRVLLQGGLAAYGGFLGGTLGLWLVLRRGEDLLRLLDVCVPTLGLGIALTRVGCFLGGCDFGVVTALPWAVRHPPGSLAFDGQAALGWVGPFSASSLAVHPTQLYEAALGLAICLFALGWLKRRRGETPDGRVFLSAVAIYGLGRFAVEMLRGDVDRGIWFGSLSSSQLVSLLLIGFVAIVAVRRFGWPRFATPSGPALRPSGAVGLLVAALLLGGASTAYAADVAVVGTHDPAAPAAAIRDGLIDALAGAMSGVTVMPPVTARATLAARGVEVWRASADAPPWAGVSLLLEVWHVVAVGVTLDGSDAGLDAVVYDARGTERWRFREPCPGCSASAMSEAARRLGARVGTGISGKPPESAPDAGSTGLVGDTGTGTGTGTGGTGTGGTGTEPTGTPPVSSPVERPMDDPDGPGEGDIGATGPGDSGPGVATSVTPFYDDRPLSWRLGVGPNVVLGRRTVPTLGYNFALEGSYTAPSRTEIGGLFAFFFDGDSRHFTLAATIEWKMGPALKNAPYMGGSIGATYIYFVFGARPIVAFDTRLRVGWEFLFGKTVGLRLEPLNISFKMSGAFGPVLVPAWEPRLALSVRFDTRPKSGR